MKLRGFCKRTVCIAYGDVRILYRIAMETMEFRWLRTRYRTALKCSE